jgi:hypothetical protein
MSINTLLMKDTHQILALSDIGRIRKRGYQQVSQTTRTN